MAENDAQERTHEPTERRRKQFREKGEVPKSSEVTGTLGLASGALILGVFMNNMAHGLREIFAIAYAGIREKDFDIVAVEMLTHEVVFNMFSILAGPLILLWLSAGLVAGIQGRGALPKEPLKFDLEKLNPLPGFKKIFMSSTPLVELFKGLLKLGLVGWLVYSAVMDRVGLLPQITQMTVMGVLSIHFELAKMVVITALPIALVIAVIDYGHQWWQLQERMMMTREEVKEEHKDMEGDPHLRAARRARQREIASVNAVRSVRTADVVLTNPTHYAVALRYRTDEAPAPVVVARGVDHLALRIKAEARAHDVPTIENRQLARALYAHSKVGKMIPEDLYGAVASVLAVIMQRRKVRVGQGSPGPRP